MDPGDRPEADLPAQLPATLESLRRSGILSRLSFADGRRLDSQRLSIGISAALFVVGLSVLIGWPTAWAC